MQAPRNSQNCCLVRAPIVTARDMMRAQRQAPSGPPHFVMALPRLPMSFRERVLLQFRNRVNELYLVNAFRSSFPPGDPRLEFILRTMPQAMEEYGATHGQGGVLLDSDPLAIRGSASRSSNLLEELRHMNQAFFHQRIREASHSMAPGVGAKGAHSDRGVVMDDEPLFYQQFVADSLRPPGLESLNGGGPLWALHEDQSPAALDGGRPRHAPEVRFNPSVGEEDMAWGAGQGHRSAEAAVAEYYAEQGFADPDGMVNTPVTSAMGAEDPYVSHLAEGQYDAVSDTFVGRFSRSPAASMSAAGPTNLQIAAAVREGRTSLGGVPLPPAAATMGGAGRFQRRGIPRWQRGGRRNEIVSSRWQSQASPGMAAADPWAIYDETDGTTEETLGSGSAEFGGERLGHVRRFDMSRLRHPQGEETTLLGGRTW